MSSMDWIDAHCHLASEKLKSHLPQVIERSQQVGVTGWIQGGIEPKDWERQLELKQEYGNRFVTSFGLHPWWVGTASRDAALANLSLLEEKLPKSQACGELGLDFGKSHDFNRPLQVELFQAQLALAQKHLKPLILHVVKAHSETLEILKSYAPFPQGGIVHSFTGSFEIAESYLKLGFLISVGGAVTQEGYFGLKKAIPLLSLPQIVVETDSPDQTPKVEGIEIGALNEPRFLLAIADHIAQLKGTSAEEVLSQSTQNLEKLFRI
jgi:TatD DNase family protein